jgi:hypothetical protein
MKNLLKHSYVVVFCVLTLVNTAYSQADLYLDSINVYVNSYSKLSVYSLPDTTTQLARFDIMVGTGIDSVFDERNDMDIVDTTILKATPSFGDYEIYGAYNNNYSGLPPTVCLRQSVYCWQHQNSFIVKATILNQEDTPINQIFGLELIPELEGTYAGNDTFMVDKKTGIFSNRKTASLGYKFLNASLTSLGAFVYNSTYSGSDTVFWNNMSSGKIDTSFITDPNDPAVDDPVIIPAVAAKTLAPGDSTTYYVAVAFGTTYDKMLYNMALAEQKYKQITAIRELPGTTPKGYALSANYPNPFNPSTKISFSVPRTGDVSLKVYDMLGKEVTTLVDKEMNAGSYTVDFNASNLASGVYLYRIQSGSFVQTRQMVLLK